MVISLGCSVTKLPVRFEIKREAPAIGLTLGWSLPEAELQKIVDHQCKPLVKDGMGFLMLFIATSRNYYLNDVRFDNLSLAHIVIPVEGKTTINAPLTIAPKDQNINQTLKDFGFKMETGQVNLDMDLHHDSISIQAQITTGSGSITMSTTFLNKPGELKNIDFTTITATNNPDSFFAGSESYTPIPIPSIKMEHTGINWITKLGLTSTPGRVWLNTEFVWDFMFMRK